MNGPLDKVLRPTSCPRKWLFYAFSPFRINLSTWLLTVLCRLFLKRQRKDSVCWDKVLRPTFFPRKSLFYAFGPFGSNLRKLNTLIYLINTKNGINKATLIKKFHPVGLIRWKSASRASKKSEINKRGQSFCFYDLRVAGTPLRVMTEKLILPQFWTN